MSKTSDNSRSSDSTADSNHASTATTNIFAENLNTQAGMLDEPRHPSEVFLSTDDLELHIDLTEQPETAPHHANYHLEANNPGPLIGPENTVAATWALFAGIGLLMIGNGLQGSLIGIRSDIEGFSTLEAGSVMTFYFVGILAGSRAVTRNLSNVGHIRVFAALASLASGAALVHALAPIPLSWALMRFVTGFCMAGLYVVAESWINNLATNKTRGKLMAIYMAVTMGGFSLGQLLLNVADPAGFELFVVTSLLVSLSLVPVSLSASSAPPSIVPTAMSLKALAAIVPTGIAASLLVGMAHGALLGMGAVYASTVGLRPSQVALFMGAPMLGGFVLQIPIGSLSDRVPRRGVMLAVAIGAVVTTTGLLVAPTSGPITYLLMFLVGGCSFPLYSLSISYTNDWLEQAQILGASAALVTVNSIGAVVGPLLAAGLMIVFSSKMYFVALIATHAAIAIYLVYRIVVVDALDVDDQRDFIPFPARASAGAVNLLARKIPPAITKVSLPVAKRVIHRKQPGGNNHAAPENADAEGPTI